MSKVIKNYIYNLSYQILILIVPLITTPYISRVLGAKGVGVFSYTNSIVQYFILFGCIGLNLYGQREIAYAQHDENKRDKTFWELVIIRICTITASLLIFCLTLASRGKYSNIFILMTIDILASMVDISWFFQGIEEFKIIVIRNFFIKVLGVALIFIFVKNSDDLSLYVLCHSGVIFLGNLSMWLYIPKYVKKKTLNTLEIRKHIKPSVILFLPQIATAIYGILDKTMIGLLTGMEEEVAYYEQGQKIVKLVLTLLTSVGIVMLPRVANLFKLKEIGKINYYLGKSFSFTFFISFPMMFGLMAVSCNIVPWFFGMEFNKVIPNIMVISPILIFIALSNIIGIQYLLPTGKQKEYTISVVLGCIINFILNIFLIPHLLSIGAAIATVIAELSVTCTQIYFTRNEFDMKLIIFNNWKCIICSAIMFFPIYLLASILSPTFIHTIMCILFGILVYTGLLLFMRDKTLLEVIDRANKRIKMLNVHR